MIHNRSWINLPRVSPQYQVGVEEFLQFAFANIPDGGLTWFPCRKCYNRQKQTKKTLHDHLLKNLFLENYYIWTLHGEQCSNTEVPMAEFYDEVNVVDEGPDIAIITLLVTLPHLLKTLYIQVMTRI